MSLLSFCCPASALVFVVIVDSEKLAGSASVAPCRPTQSGTWSGLRIRTLYTPAHRGHKLTAANKHAHMHSHTHMRTWHAQAHKKSGRFACAVFLGSWTDVARRS